MNSDKVTVFTGHIREHAPKYFPGFGSNSVVVQLLEKEERPSATLYRFAVKDDSRTHSIFVKVPVRNLSKDSNGNIYKKPSLYQKVDTQDMHWLQYTALTSIYEYFTNLDNKHLGAIRVLDYLPLYHAIFMEESSDPKLQQLFLKESRLRFPPSHGRLTTAFHNVGSWLHIYHSMPKNEDVQVRHQHREDYFEVISKLNEFLIRSWGDEPFFKQVTSVLINNGRKILPELLPLGLGHGDYAMRNILIGQNSRVTVLDTLAKWRTPIYEDIGYFLNGLKTSYPQVISQGLLFNSSQLATYEAAFLNGYFGARTIPYSAVRSYEILALLDKWSSVLMYYHQRSAKLKTFGRAKVVLASRYFKRSATTLLRQINEVELSGRSPALRRSY